MQQATVSPKLLRLRELMSAKQLDAYLVPHNDAHDSEYISKIDERLAFISGFTGSAGIGLVAQDFAYLWTDSRYFLQATTQLEPGWELQKLQKDCKHWFDIVKDSNLKRVGFDPLLLNASTFQTRRDQLKKEDIELNAEETNLVDQVWGAEKPNEETKQVFVHDDSWTGRNVQSKLTQVFEKVTTAKASSTLTANLAQIAWVLNLRGSDIEFNPVFFSYLYLQKDEQGTITGTLYIDPSKVSEPVAKHLTEGGITTKSYLEVFEDVEKLTLPLLINKGEINTRLFSKIPETLIVTAPQHPIEQLKAVKNEREVQGFRDSHVRDGAALVRYLAWLDRELKAGRTDLTEHQAAEKLAEYRYKTKHNMGLSFDSISSTGANAAVVHYKPPKEGSKIVAREDIYLIDSGGQYLDGTTDVTRTLHFGTPTQQEKDAYTRVLLGNLDIEKLRYPAKSSIHGGDIDVLARRWLWAAGLDYGHGTGHGVGYFLNVHEGPNGISKYRTEPLVPGMIVSNEPGYYADGKFGIRIENLIVVVDHGNGFWGFENLTVCPYDSNLIDLALIPKEYVQLVNKYHQEVLEKLTPELSSEEDKDTLDWLIQRCLQIP